MGKRNRSSKQTPEILHLDNSEAAVATSRQGLAKLGFSTLLQERVVLEICVSLSDPTSQAVFNSSPLPAV